MASKGRLFGGGGPRVEDEELLRHQTRSTSAGSNPPLLTKESNSSSDYVYAEMGSPALLQQPQRIGDADDSGRHKRTLTGGGGGGKLPATKNRGNSRTGPAAVGHDYSNNNNGGGDSDKAKQELREVYFNYAPGNAVFDKSTNVVITSKYNVLTFLPKFLKESFTKVANFFFLVVCVLQSIDSISNTYGVPTNAPVLLFVISIDAVFAIMEDMRRHTSDREANSAKCHIVRNGHIEDHLWSEVKVGDFLQIRNREVIPADVLILSVSEPVGEAASGICYVETKSLDGETNLKLRQAIQPTMNALVNPQELVLLRGIVKFETPNPYINKFAGKVEVTVSEGCGMEVMPLSVKNVLLRGCNLRNTDWVFGLVLNTGPDTKIMQSASAAPSKWSDVMLSMNKMIAILCLGLFVACAVAATCYVTWQYDIVRNTWYIKLSDDVRAQPRWESFIQMMFYYFLLLYQVIPISLYVSMTSVKFLQAKFMVWDLEMYHAETDTPAIVRTMALNEELGQISYVFSDKTGTLTCNIMEFRKCSINGISYGSGMTEIGRAALVRANKPIPPEPKMDAGMKKMQYVNFVDPSFFKAMNGGTGAAQRDNIHQFFEHLAVCHTVIPEKLETGEVRLSASSPDEQALVAGASFVGFNFVNRGVGKATIEIFGERQVFDILDVLEFNSTRKRMSVVVRRPNGELYLYSKGADMMIYQRLKDDPAMDQLKKVTRDHMEKYADDGLRTLALAVKKLDEKWFQKWKIKFDEAQGNVAELDRRKDGKPNAIDSLMEEIEENLELIGATAIEDKLQDGVPKCLAHLTAAGIKVWMLTGDKEETAINIAYACSLLDNSIQQVIVNCTTCPNEEAIIARLNAAGREYREKTKADSKLEISLIIDGEALEWALSPRTAPHLLEFTKLCRAVICNRVSPAQKAEMVRLVRDNIPVARTLAIGDGANDVAMIQAAHVGVGISGQEGMQAVNSSDYAIAQFRFLERLLLVHGRWNYIRISKLVLYMFYKNITLVLAQYWYGYLSGASGSKMYWELGVQVYNVAFTGIPIIMVGVMDKDLPARFSIEYPDLYRKGPERYYFNMYTFLRWVGAAVFESLVIFVVMSYGFNASESAPGSESRVEYGMVAFSMTVLIVNIKIWLISDTWTFLSLICWSLSVLSWFGFAAMGTEVTFFSRFKVAYDEFGSFAPTAWSWGYVLVVLMGCVIALGRHFTYNQYQRAFYPELNQVLQESVEKRKRRLTINHIEEQTLSMSLDDVHATAFMSDFRGTDLTVKSYRTNSGGVNMHDAIAEDEIYESSGGGVPSLAMSDNVSLTADSFSASVYSSSVSSEVGSGWDRIPTKLFKSNASRRNTGYAFSCDEETTLAESYIASNSLPRSDAVPAALRNSISRHMS
uniref:Phospholipid-transporting ATPase n=1 Tax=Globisporangium ultimum (strain ATCC 200006 / CBS 805.95 / DAOM BR144) TaxID=431595 RepID=K3W6I2_GLOUD